MAARRRSETLLVTTIRAGERSRHPDELIVEEPMTVQLDGITVSTTMRTPGNDYELAVGFCHTEGLLAGCAVVGSQTLAGLVTGAVVARTAVALPALLLGIAAGVGLCGRISEAAFRRVVLFVLAATAVSLLLQGVSGLLAG